MSLKDLRTEELLRHLAAEFISRESNRLSLITVTAVQLSDRRTHATVFVTIFPEDRKEEALDFMNRNRSEFREYIKKHAKLQKLPYVQFALDLGEKNRQRIDELSSEEEQ